MTVRAHETILKLWSVLLPWVSRLEKFRDYPIREPNHFFCPIRLASDERQRIIQRKLDYKCSTWLTVLPKQDNFFSMSADEFRDALSLRYGRTPPKMPSSCDADGESFDLNHTLNCPRGGLVYGRHNEIRELNCHLFELAGLKQITSEPILCESDVNGENGLRADWGA